VVATAHPAGELGTFTVSVTVPADTPRGAATITDGGVGAAAVRLTVSR
jgi:hypothetical protein